jgi:hypothetical protein
MIDHATGEEIHVGDKTLSDRVRAEALNFKNSTEDSLMTAAQTAGHDG